LISSFKQALLAHRIRPLRIALKNQRDDLLAFAQVLDEKLVEIAQRFDTPLYLVRAVCLLQKKSPLLVPTGSAGIICTIYYQESSPFNGSRKPGDATRASSLVENLNSRLRNYFSSVVGPQYLDLLQFSSTIARLCAVSVRRWARVPQLMTGQPHAHWLELLGFERFQRA